MTSDSKLIFLLWLAGNALRLTILAVPPVLALIQSDLNLTGTQIGILSGLPVILFALAAVPGSLLIAQFGARNTLIIGILVAAFGGALRGVSPEIWTLYASTIVMGAGVAVMQPALPALVRQWLPKRIGFGAAVFTNGLLVGEILPVALTATVLLPLFAAGWRFGLAFWSLPMLAIALVLLVFAPRDAKRAANVARPRWWPDWRDGTMWRLALALGAANCVYFGTNAFLPGYLTSVQRPDLISAALTSLNVGQIPASLLLVVFASKLERRAWPLALTAILMLIGMAGVVTTAGTATIFYAGLVGFGAAGSLAISLALPGLLFPSADVGRVSAAMFVVSYLEGVILTVLGGVSWDFFGDPRFAFLPPALGMIVLLVLPFTVDFSRRAD